MKLSNQTKGLLILLTPFVLGFLLGLAVGGGCSSSEKHREPVEQTDEEEVFTEPVAAVSEPEQVEEEKPAQKEIIYYKKRMKYATLFNDLNEEHLSVARKVGLSKPLQSSAEALNKKGLVKIQSNSLYTIYSLSHSSPYLTPGAADELKAIASAFRDSLSHKGLLNYRLVVSSVLRSQEDVNKLRRSGNPNASANSAHCYGTTFDITYTMYDRDNDAQCAEFMQPFELTKVLGEVLLDRKKAGKCLVKYERKEHCFHITSTH